MNEALYEVIITTPSYGEFSGVSIFLTPAIREKFKELSKKDGRPLIDKLGEGSAVQGLKHLIIKIKNLNKESKLILTDGRTHQEGTQFYINYEEYRRKASERFYELYRETGLDIASSYLNSYFPDEFEYDPNELKESEIKRIQKEIPSLIREAPDTENNQLALVEKTTESLKKVRRKNKHLELANQHLQRQSNLTHFTTRLNELLTRLNSTKGFHETKGDNSWQTWIFQNKWLFGTQYLPPIEKEKIGFDSIPDFLFPTFDGFLDIIEIKLPKFEVVRKDDSHSGSWAWCPKTNLAIGQVVNYLKEMEKFQLQIAEKINEIYGDDYNIPIYSVKPRAFIIIGNSENWKPTQLKALRNLNYSLHGIQILTYHDLYQRGKGIITMLSQS